MNRICIGHLSLSEEAPPVPGLSSVVDSTCSWVLFINNSSYRPHERRDGEDGARRRDGERTAERDEEDSDKRQAVQGRHIAMALYEN